MIKTHYVNVLGIDVWVKQKFHADTLARENRKVIEQVWTEYDANEITELSKSQQDLFAIEIQALLEYYGR